MLKMCLKSLKYLRIAVDNTLSSFDGICQQKTLGNVFHRKLCYIVFPLKQSFDTHLSQYWGKVGKASKYINI